VLQAWVLEHIRHGSDISNGGIRSQLVLNRIPDIALPGGVCREKKGVLRQKWRVGGGALKVPRM
jgi:hypothetical protein